MLCAAARSVFTFLPLFSEPWAPYDAAPEATLKNDVQSLGLGVTSSFVCQPKSRSGVGLILETSGSGIAGPVQGGFQP